MVIISKPVPRALLAVAVAVLAFGAAIALSLHSSKKPTPAFGASVININPGNVPTTAIGDGGPKTPAHVCDANEGGGPLPGQDIWVFVLPGNPDTSGEFVSITAQFRDENNVPQVRTITTALNPGNFNTGDPGTSKGWIITPAGWTLTGAQATITGTAEFFNLTHTCPASMSPSPSPTTSMSRSPSPSPTMTRSPSPSPTMTRSPSPSPTMTRSPSPTPTMTRSPSPSPTRTHSPRPSPTKSGYGYDNRYTSARSDLNWWRVYFG
jgi:hypothetical protein